MLFSQDYSQLYNDFLLFDSISDHSSPFTTLNQPTTTTTTTDNEELNNLLQRHDSLSALLNSSQPLNYPEYLSCPSSPLVPNPSTFDTRTSNRKLSCSELKDNFESFVDLSQCSAYPTPFDTPQSTPYLDTPYLDDFEKYSPYPCLEDSASSSFPLFDEVHQVSPSWYDDLEFERAVTESSPERTISAIDVVETEDRPNILDDTSAISDLSPEDVVETENNSNILDDISDFSPENVDETKKSSNIFYDTTPMFVPLSEIPKDIAVVAPPVSSVSSPRRPRKASTSRSGGGPMRKYACDFPGCDRAFARHFNLRSHKGTHYPEFAKSFQCELCDKSFSRKHDLTRHSASVHRGERQFSCENCAKDFCRKDALQRHLALNGCDDE